MSLLILLKAINLPNISNRTASVYDVPTLSKTYVWYHVPNSWTFGLLDFRLTNQGISLTYFFKRVNCKHFSETEFVIISRCSPSSLTSSHFFNCNHRIKIYHLGKFLKFS